MSSGVEGKPGVRLVWWCVEHDREAVWSIHDGAVRWCELNDGPVSDCRCYRFELRQHGYEKIEWGEQ